MAKPKHALSQTRIYHIFAGMKQRCYNEKNSNYWRYGGNGIKICDQWLNDFMEFYNWAQANGYGDDLTIDRIDPDGDYSPENCRWITLSENSSRTRKYVPDLVRPPKEVRKINNSPNKYQSQKKYLEKKKQLRVWVDETKYTQFKNAVEQNQTSIYALINQFIDDYLNEQGRQ